MKAHQYNSKTFEELTFAEQAKSISAQILSLEKAITAHKRRTTEEGRNISEKHAQLTKQLQRMIKRLNLEESIL